MWFLFKILHVRGRNTCLCKGELCFILLGGVFTSFIAIGASFSYSYTGLVTIFTYIGFIFTHTYTHTHTHTYIYMMNVVLHLSLHVLFLFYLYTHVSLCMQSLFMFHTKMPWWVLFKVFQKDRLWKSIMPWTLFLQSFSRVFVRVRFVCNSQVL